MGAHYLVLCSTACSLTDTAISLSSSSPPEETPDMPVDLEADPIRLGLPLTLVLQLVGLIREDVPDGIISLPDPSSEVKHSPSP
ncbi:hypothetical protein FKM82_026653 [Ascaphus truei]